MIQFWTSLAQKLPVLLLIFLSAVAVVTGDYLAKSWSLSQRTWFFVGAFLAYGIASLFYIPTLLREGLIITSLTWTIIATLGFLLVGIVLFKEQLTLGQWIGVGFGVIALVILSMTGK